MFCVVPGVSSTAVGERESGLASGASLLCQSSVKYFSVDKKDFQFNGLSCWLKIPGNLEPSKRRLGQFPPNIFADSAVKAGTCICRAPQDLTWAPALGRSIGSGGSQAWGPAALLGCPRSLESQPGEVIKETQLLHTLTSLKARKLTYFENWTVLLLWVAVLLKSYSQYHKR